MIYKLKRDTKQYKTIDVDQEKLFDIYADDPEAMLEIIEQVSIVKSVTGSWKPLTCEFKDISRGKQAQEPTISTFLSYLVISDDFFSEFSSALAPFGEFLSIYVGDAKYHAFNCLTLGQEDEQKTTAKYMGDIEIGLETLAFEHGDVSDKPIFKSAREGGVSLFCNEAFKRLCENLGVKGIEFDEDLLSIF